MEKRNMQYQVVVVGGGLAGFCAAVAAARLGVKTCILQNRPVFGGNSSSEVRVTPHGAAAFHAYARETGIISELLIEERALNHERFLKTAGRTACGTWCCTTWHNKHPT
jgi:flavin-dependent dehydrogenase